MAQMSHNQLAYSEGFVTGRHERKRNPLTGKHVFANDVIRRLRGHDGVLVREWRSFWLGYLRGLRAIERGN